MADARARWQPLLITLMALCMLGCGKGPSNPGAQRGGLAPATPVSTVPPAPVMPPPGSSTLAYWNQINAAFAQAGTQLRVRGTPEQKSAVLRNAAGIIHSLPTLGVDPAAVGWALRAGAVCEQLADFIQVSNHTGLLLEAFVRGYDGDLFGVGIELVQAERQCLANYQAVRQEGIRLRAALTAHYRIEFPPPAF